MGMQNICPSNIATPFENFGENFKGGPQCTSVTPKLLAHVGSKISKVEGEGRVEQVMESLFPIFLYL